MAINLILNKILITLKEEGVVGHGLTDSIFEIGEQNWYGDIQAIDYLEKLIKKYVKPEEKNDFLKEYESIKVIKHLRTKGLEKELEIITRYTYTPPEGGKGWIITVRTKK